VSIRIQERPPADLRVVESSKEISTMTAPDSLPLHVLAEENLAAASPDLPRAMVKTFADALMSAEADALCNAAHTAWGPGPTAPWLP